MADFRDRLRRCKGFQWDKRNVDKNWRKHRVSRFECEQVFFHQPLLVAYDESHSQQEDRFFALGRTDLGKELFVVFRIRDDFIRRISARPMSQKERKVYADDKEETSEA